MFQQASSWAQANQKDLSKALCLALIVVCWSACLYQAVADLLAGGTPYRQADWLINNHAGFIRRGLPGSGILLVADGLGVSPLLVLAILQAAVVSVFFGFFTLLVLALDWKAGHLLLIVSPASFVMLWLSDFDGRLMKEIIVYSSLASLVYGYASGRRAFVGLAVVLFIFACLAHEASVVLTPAFAFIVLTRRARPSDSAEATGAIAVAVGAAAVSVALALVFRTAPDAGGVCGELVERGIDRSICGGAIAWLENDLGMARNLVAKLAAEFGLERWLLLYALGLSGLVVYCLHLSRPLAALGLLLGLVICILPLYFVAIDWGRWTNMQVTSFSLVIIHLLLQGRLTLRREVHPVALAAFVAVAFLYSPSHVIETSWGVAGELGKLILH